MIDLSQTLDRLHRGGYVRALECELTARNEPGLRIGKEHERGVDVCGGAVELPEPGFRSAGEQMREVRDRRIARGGKRARQFHVGLRISLSSDQQTPKPEPGVRAGRVNLEDSTEQALRLGVGRALGQRICSHRPWTNRRATGRSTRSRRIRGLLGAWIHQHLLSPRQSHHLGQTGAIEENRGVVRQQLRCAAKRRGCPYRLPAMSETAIA